MKLLAKLMANNSAVDILFIPPGFLKMSSRQQDPATSVSPVLFLTVTGEPMSFFLRPGPLKRQLQPLITAGGGILCRVQQPGAILLIDPEEKSSIPEYTAHWWVLHS